MKEVCNLKDLIDGKGKRFIIDDNDIAVFLIKGKVYALSNICPHQHSPIIYDGFIEDEFIVCPAHGWRFRLEDGKKESGHNGLKSYPVKIESEKVFVEIFQNKLKW